MDRFLEVIQHLWGRTWFHEILIFLFFACVFLWYKIAKTERYLRWRVKRSPQDFQAHLKLGEFLSEFEDSYEEAELEFKKALEIEPKNRDALGKLYLVQEDGGNIDTAEKTILELLQLFPNDSTVNVWAGRHYADKDSIKAEEYFVKAKSLVPDSQFVLQNFGYFLQKQNRIEEAINTFIVSLKINPNSIYSLRFVVTLLGNSERYKEAEEYARQLISISPNNANDNYSLGLTLFHLNNYVEAEPFLRKAYKLNPKDVNIQINLGKAFSELERSNDAEKIFINALKLEPKNFLVYIRFADFLRKMSRLDETRKFYNEAIKLKEEDLESHFKLGTLLADEMKLLDEAESIFKKAIKINKDFIFTYTELGSLYLKKYQFEDAEKIFRKALEIDSKNNYANQRLSMLLIKSGRATEAIDVLLEMRENNSDEYFVYIELAAAYKAIGKQEEMLESLETSRLLIKRNSKNELYDLACVESIAGNTDLAFDYLRKSKEENQLNSEWAWEDSDLDWIRDDPRFVEIVGEKTQEKLSN